MTLPEVRLWQRLRRRAAGVKFRRQHPIAGYVLDFYCPALRLAVEVGGEAHDRGDRPQRDTRRDAILDANGLTVLHLAAVDVLRDPDAVADAMMRAASPLHRPMGGSPPHAPHGEDLAGAA
nr:endonuclease domain-containing protein [Sphingomonas sp. Mn802worker]